MNRREFIWNAASFSGAIVKPSLAGSLGQAVPNARSASGSAISSAFPQTYYVDNSGSDSNDGLAEGAGRAWASCAKVNAMTLNPGDTVIFAAGQTFAGPLNITNSGTAGSYIRIGTGRNAGVAVPDFYERGAGDPWPGTKWSAASNPAIIQVQDAFGADRYHSGGINLINCEYVWIDNLKAVGSGCNKAANTPLNRHEIGFTTSHSAALLLTSSQTTQALRGVRITAIEGSGCLAGMAAFTDGDTYFGWDGLQVYRCSFHDCQWFSLHLFAAFDLKKNSAFGNNPSHPSTYGYCGYCDVYDIPGHAGQPIKQGIGGPTIFAANDGLVEYCVCHDIQHSIPATASAGTTGIAFLGARRYTFRCCEVYKVRKNGANMDGTGFESEPSWGDCIFEYCYAHDNDGPGFGIDSGTIRYCVSARNMQGNTGTAIGNLLGEITHNGDGNHALAVYGCTIINTITGQGRAAFADMNYASASQVTNLYNNIFVTPSSEASVLLGTSGGVAKGNIYYNGRGAFKTKKGATTYTSLADWRDSGGFERHSSVDYGLFGDPLLINPSGAPTGGTLPTNPVAIRTEFNPTTGSPAINAGISYSALGINPGRYDFHRGTNFSGGHYDAGAVETLEATNRPPESPDTRPRQGSRH